MLKEKLESLDGLSESEKQHYNERDGMFYLDVEGQKTSADFDAINKSLVNERKSHKETKDRLRSFDGIDAETVRADLEELVVLRETEGKVDPEIIEKASSAKVLAATTPLQQQIDQLNNEMDTVTSERDKLKMQDDRRFIEDSSKAAMTKAGITDPLRQQDVLLHIKNEFSLNDERQLLNNDSLDLATWLSAKKSERADWWGTTTPDAAGGSGGKGSALNPWKLDSWNTMEQAKIYKQDRAEAERLAKAAGTKIGGGRPAK